MDSKGSFAVFFIGVVAGGVLVLVVVLLTLGFPPNRVITCASISY
jgi:hypothetical protein